MLTSKARLILTTAALAGGCAFLAPAASAQATRTWVSGVGDDVNPCSRTAPCKTFAGAISKTAAGGEINCLDPGGFGTVTITKSITIDCTGTVGSILSSATNGIVINDGTGAAVVVLRGLNINGAPPTATGLNGIRFLNGAALTVENVFITGFLSAAPNGSGIAFLPSGYAKLSVRNSSLVNNANGIVITPTGAGGKADVVVDNIQVTGNTLNGLVVDTTGNTGGGIRTSVNGSVFSNNNGSGVSVVVPGATTGVNLNINGSTITRNLSVGVNGNGSSMNIRVSNTTIAENSQGLGRTNGAIINSYGNNRVFNNSVDGTFSSVLPQQ